MADNEDQPAAIGGLANDLFPILGGELVPSLNVCTKANAELPWKFNFGNVAFALRRSASVGPDVCAAAAAAATAVPARL
eukprot:3379691-Amphidinium_carterae.1